MSVAISNKIGFVEWHIARGGWVSYANDFPAFWSGCDLIVDFSSGVLIIKRVIEEIGTATPVGKGKEKKIKKETSKKYEVEESAEGIEAEQGTKRRKTASACKQLTIFEDPGEVDPSAIGKEVNHPPIPKIRVTTKVESSILQIPMGFLKETSFVVVTFVAQDSLGSPASFLNLPRDLLGIPVVSRILLKDL